MKGPKDDGCEHEWEASTVRDMECGRCHLFREVFNERNRLKAEVMDAVREIKEKYKFTEHGLAWMLLTEVEFELEKVFDLT